MTEHDDQTRELQHRMASAEKRLAAGDRKFDDLHKQIGDLAARIADMTERMSRDLHDIKEVVVTFQNVKGFVWTIRVACFAAKVVGVFGALAYAIWWLGKTGNWTFRL